MQPRHMPSTNKGTLLSHIQHDVQDAQVLLCRAHDIHWYMELFLPRCRIWHFSLMNFMRLMSAHFSSLSWSLWVAAQSCGVSATPPIVVSSANFQRVHFAPSVRSLMKKLKRTGSTIDSVSGVHPGSWWKGWLHDTHHLPLGLATHPIFSSPHCLLIQPMLHLLFHEDLVEGHAEGFANVKADNTHYSPLIYRPVISL